MQKIWKPKTEKDKKNNAILKIINKNIVDKIKKRRSQATIFRTPEYQLLPVKNAKFDI